ncbi:GNAT family N-acetyltransferase [Herbiconiux sp. L3-i23]|uniref:GNAT family N-acetyltransferase n=1 Tax=Herbiconiux sp. L3-i23 TaxID=2905871 RepID=UPI002059CE2F|nr:GNAT family N-acetyltransferase [Herbiconiux sp. L3-i23]BDI22362.1 N-acetyltransferase [Herbiconiux sp. L3-i23]
MDLEFLHERDAHRYTARVGGDLVSALDYALSPTEISFTHTFTPPPHRGKGYAGKLVDFAIDDVETTTELRVRPMCWYVGEWFDKHPERANLLTR